MLEVISDGEIIARYPVPNTEANVRINGTAIEITANGQVLDRYHFDHAESRRRSKEDGEWTEIPIGEPKTSPTNSVMFW